MHDELRLFVDVLEVPPSLSAEIYPIREDLRLRSRINHVIAWVLTASELLILAIEGCWELHGCFRAVAVAPLGVIPLLMLTIHSRRVKSGAFGLQVRIRMSPLSQLAILVRIACVPVGEGKRMAYLVHQRVRKLRGGVGPFPLFRFVPVFEHGQLLRGAHLDPDHVIVLLDESLRLLF